MTDNLRGSAFMVLAMIGFGIEDAFFKAATNSGGTSPGMGTLQYGLMAMLIYAALLRARGTPLWHPAFLQTRLLIRTGFELCGRIFFALSLAYTPLATTTAILQAAPLVVTLGAALVLREKVGPRRWIAMTIGFAGVLLILRPTADGLEANAIFAILGMIGFAGRDLATRTSPPQVHAHQLGILGFAVVTAAGLAILAFEPQPLGMRTGEVSVVAPFRYSRLLVALVLAVLLFGETPDALTLLGAAIIVASGTYTLLRRPGPRPQ